MLLLTVIKCTGGDNILCEVNRLWVKLGKMSNRKSEILEYWMICTTDTVLAVIRIEMVTDALEVGECAEWEKKSDTKNMPGGISVCKR